MIQKYFANCRNQTKTLLGIETVIAEPSGCKNTGRNQTKTLLGIETVDLEGWYGVVEPQSN